MTVQHCPRNYLILALYQKSEISSVVGDSRNIQFLATTLLLEFDPVALKEIGRNFYRKIDILRNVTCYFDSCYGIKLLISVTVHLITSR